MGESKEKLITAVKHYQDSLERHTKTGNVEKLLHAIEKLARLPIKVCHLEETGVGRTVNGLKKFEGSVGENARGLVDKWKNMVKGEEEEEERARLEKEQEVQEEDEDENDTSYEDTLQIVEPEEDTTKDNVKVIDSSHRQSSSSNKQSHNSKHSSRHKKSKRHHSSSDSDSSELNHQSKRHKSSKNYRKDSDSDSDSSDSSRQRSSKNKYKSSKSSSESGDDSSSDSRGYSSSDRVSTKSKSKSSKESKDRKYKKSSSDSDRDKSRDRHYSSKDKSRDHSKSKSEKESSLKKESSSKSRSESKYKKDKKFSSRSEDTKKESSLSHRENGKTSVEKRRPKASSTDKEVKRPKNEHSDNQDSSSSKNMDKYIKKSEDSSRKDEDRKNSSKKSSKDKPKSSGSKMVDLDCIDSGSGTSFAAALGMLAPVTSKPKKKMVENSQPTKSNSSNGTSSKTSSSKESSSKHSSSKESSSKSSSSREPSSKNSSSKQSSTKRNSSKDSSSKSTSSVGSSPSKSHHRTSEATNSKNVGIEEVDLFKNPTNLEPLPQNIDISNLLPQITPHYKPLGMSLDGFRRNLTDDEALSRVITAKHQRTKVYSGNKASYTKVPSLFDICCRILQDNIDALEYTGGVPYSILKPILEKANPDQLYQLEFHNPYLIDDTDELWQLHCQKEFRNKKKEEMESGREMYLRCLDEREAKLKALTANIKQSQDKSVPVRQTKLAYIDSVVKPPRNIARKQARNGTILDTQRPAQTTQERLTQIAKAGEAGKVVVPKPGRPVSEKSSSSHLKPKKAPLMAKTLSLLKNRFGRR